MAKKGAYSIPSRFSTRFRNGHFPTICDFAVSVIYVRAGHNREIGPFLEVVAHKKGYIVMNRTLIVELKRFRTTIRGAVHFISLFNS